MCACIFFLKRTGKERKGKREGQDREGKGKEGKYLWSVVDREGVGLTTHLPMFSHPPQKHGSFMT